MKRWIFAALSLVALAGCGADGEPIQPSLNATVGLSSSGVGTYGAVGLRQGPLSLYLGF